MSRRSYSSDPRSATRPSLSLKPTPTEDELAATAAGYTQQLGGGAAASGDAELRDIELGIVPAASAADDDDGEGDGGDRADGGDGGDGGAEDDVDEPLDGVDAPLTGLDAHPSPRQSHSSSDSRLSAPAGARGAPPAVVRAGGKAFDLEEGSARFRRSMTSTLDERPRGAGAGRGAASLAPFSALQRSSTWTHAQQQRTNDEARLGAELQRIVRSLTDTVQPSPNVHDNTFLEARRTRTLYQEVRVADRNPPLPLTRRERCIALTVALMAASVIGLIVVVGVLLVKERKDFSLFRGASASQPLIIPLSASPLNLVEYRLRTVPVTSMNNTYSITSYVRLMNGTSAVRLMDGPPVLVTTDNVRSVGRFFLADNATAMSMPNRLSIVFETTATDPIAFELSLYQYNEWGQAQIPIACIVIVGTYVLIMIEVVHQTVAGMIGSFISLGVLSTFGKAPNIKEVVSAMDFSTLTLLFGTMILVSQLTKTGFFEFAAVRAFALSRGNIWRLTLLLSIVTGILSCFLANVTCILLIAPVTIKLAALAGVSPVPILMCEVFLTNIGGTATLIGDPPNIMIGGRIPGAGFIDFLGNTFVGCALTTPFMFVFLYFVYRKELCVTVKLDLDKLREENKINDMFVFLKSGSILLCVIIGFFLQPLHGIDVAWVAVIGAFLVLLVSKPFEIERAFQNVEWATLIFFASLFVLIFSMVELGLIEAIGNILSDLIKLAPPDSRLLAAILIILWVSGFVSAFLANIPYMATMLPVIIQITRNLSLSPRILAWALSFGANLGGNGSLIGASGNIVAGSLAAKAGHPLGFLPFLKVGFPFMIINMALISAYMLIAYIALGLGH